ncbi:hypothetical protein [Caballeronia sp. 15711]|uniref:hypothetical protein n=1 Tax=Caballeronia sp. 15711 TaxID=3391029 RepID=UPI0039E3DD42
MTVQVDFEGGVFAINIDRPENHKATDADDYFLLSKAGKPVRDDPEIHGALVTGADEKMFDSNGGEYRSGEVLTAGRVTERLAGLVGKCVIRRNQMEVIKAPVKQTQDEIEHALRIGRAFDERVGAFGLVRQMYDMPHLKQARTILAQLAHSSAVQQ